MTAFNALVGLRQREPLDLPMPIRSIHLIEQDGVLTVGESPLPNKDGCIEQNLVRDEWGYYRLDTDSYREYLVNDVGYHWLDDDGCPTYLSHWELYVDHRIAPTFRLAYPTMVVYRFRNEQVFTWLTAKVQRRTDKGVGLFRELRQTANYLGETLASWQNENSLFDHLDRYLEEMQDSVEFFYSS